METTATTEATRPDYRRVKRFPISGKMLLDLFSTGQRVRADVQEGFPPNSQIVRHYYDRDLGVYFLVVYNAQFEPVKLGDTVPLMNITFKTPEIIEGFKEWLASLPPEMREQHHAFTADKWAELGFAAGKEAGLAKAKKAA